MPIYCMLDTLTLKLHLQGVRLSLLHMQLPKSLTKQTIEEVMRSQQYMIWKEKRSFDYHTTFYIHSFFFFMENILHSFLIVNLTKTRIQIYYALQNQPTSFLKWKILQQRKKTKNNCPETKTKTIAQKQKQNNTSSWYIWR